MVLFVAYLDIFNIHDGLILILIDIINPYLLILINVNNCTITHLSLCTGRAKTSHFTLKYQSALSGFNFTRYSVRTLQQL